MYALYATQERFLPEILKNGIARESAAVFLIPEEADNRKLRATLVCSVYHGLGLRILNDAILKQITVQQSLLEHGQAGLMFVLVPTQWKLAIAYHYYEMDCQNTYPYAKIASFGKLQLTHDTLIRLGADFFDYRIDDAAAGETLRFFQKHDGMPQFLKNCNMAKLQALCISAADRLLPEVTSLLRSHS